MEVVVLGCGPSTSVPSLRCLLTSKDCAVCSEAHANPASKNRRLNPCLLVRNLREETNVLVDCGKTFREAALRLFPALNVSSVHAVVLTHGHADACLGMDDLREVQPFGEVVDPTTKEVRKIPTADLKVHCSAFTGSQVRAKFPYLLEKSKEKKDQAAAALDALAPHVAAPGSADSEAAAAAVLTQKTFRWTAKVQLEEFDAWAPFEACGLQILPFPVTHGAGYTSFGFEFGLEFGVRFVYISDVSELPEATLAFLTDADKPQIDVLLIDALFRTKYHNTHMNLTRVLEEVTVIRPKRTLLTGMSHDFDYATHNEQVQRLGLEQGLYVAMSYDGLRLRFPPDSS